MICKFKFLLLIHIHQSYVVLSVCHQMKQKKNIQQELKKTEYYKQFIYLIAFDVINYIALRANREQTS